MNVREFHPSVEETPAERVQKAQMVNRAVLERDLPYRAMSCAAAQVEVEGKACHVIPMTFYVEPEFGKIVELAGIEEIARASIMGWDYIDINPEVLANPSITKVDALYAVVVPNFHRNKREMFFDSPWSRPEQVICRDGAMREAIVDPLARGVFKASIDEFNSQEQPVYLHPDNQHLWGQ